MNSQEFYIPLNLPDISKDVPATLVDALNENLKKFNLGRWVDFSDSPIPEAYSNFFYTLGLTPSNRKTELFMQSGLEKHPIHLDGDPSNPEKFRPCAINFPWGGKTIMEWYQYKNSTVKFEDFNGHLYTQVDEQDCELLHRAVLTGANLVNISKYHTVFNASVDRRYCLSVCCEENISYQELANLCHKYGYVRQQ